MTTFQAIVYSIVHGFSVFLPIASGAHRSFVSYLLSWPEPTGALTGALSLGSLIAVLIYFIHDWLSMVSCFLQVILYRKKPMTLDERLPIFIFFTSVPVALAWYYFREHILELEWTPLWLCISLAAFGIPLWFADSFSRRNKGMFDWNILDAFIVGVSQVAMLVPGCGIQAGALPGALSRNYNREASAKYVFFSSAPLLLASTLVHLHGVHLRTPSPMPDVSWLTFTVTVIVTTLAGLLAIGGFMKQVQKSGFTQYVVYRWFVAATVGFFFWLRNR